MIGEARKALRMKLLQELYDYHFANNGSGNRMDRHIVEKEPEFNLAYQYLEERNLISIKSYGGSFFDYKITSYGIDLVESREVKSDLIL